MEGLTPEERVYLHELHNVSSSGKSVGKFINTRLYSNLSHWIDDGSGFGFWEYEAGFEAQEQIYISLFKKGLLDAIPPNSPQGNYEFKDLTSEGRCYFEMEEAARKEKAEELEEARSYARRQAIYAFIASTVVTLIVNAKTIIETFNWIVSLFT